MTIESRRTFSDAVSFEAAWVGADRRGGASEATIAKIAEALRPAGFRPFQNGGLPLLLRLRGEMRQEVVLPAGPREGEFAVRIHLSHEGVGRIRGHYWRPAIRAPMAVAAGDAGLLESPPVRSIWKGEVAEAVATRLREDALPWFEVFDDPDALRETLLADTLPLVDASTALELMLAEFGPRDARRLLRARLDTRGLPSDPAPERTGFGLDTDRVATIATYYRL